MHAYMESSQSFTRFLEKYSYVDKEGIHFTGQTLINKYYVAKKDLKLSFDEPNKESFKKVLIELYEKYCDQTYEEYCQYKEAISKIKITKRPGSKK